MSIYINDEAIGERKRTRERETDRKEGHWERAREKSVFHKKIAP